MSTPLPDRLLAPSSAATADNDERHAQRSPSAALAGPGTTRQNRKLQLRKAGFRGKTVTQRNITPNAVTPEAWINRNAVHEHSPCPDGRSPLGLGYDTAMAKQSPGNGGILQEVTNSSLRRKDRKPRAETLVSIFQDDDDSAADENQPAYAHDERQAPFCPSPRTSSFPKISKKRHGDQKRQSSGSETTRYIDHLETELAAAQERLMSMTSPTVTKARSLKMRALSAETRTLQDEIAQWESTFQERVDEEVERRTGAETRLRARMRELESTADEKDQRIKELEHQAELNSEALQAAEKANTELEKRVELFSEMLATSPKKINVQMEAPPRERRRHIRPKSMFPRVPTTGAPLPFSTPVTVPSSSPAGVEGETEGDSSLPRFNLALPFDVHTPYTNLRHSVDVGSMSAESTSAGGRPLSIASDYVSDNFHAHTPGVTALESLAHSIAKVRTGRRMRRFQAGAVGPKPLILPTTSSYGPIPASAPALGENETPPSYPFPAVPLWQNMDMLQSPLLGRRRASTIAGGPATIERSPSPLPHATPPASSSSQTSLLRDRSPNESTPRDFSSLGLAVGRNLFDELANVREGSTSSVLRTPDVSSQSAVNTYEQGPPTLLEPFSASPAARKPVHDMVLRPAHAGTTMHAPGFVPASPLDLRDAAAVVARWSPTGAHVDTSRHGTVFSPDSRSSGSLSLLSPNPHRRVSSRDVKDGLLANGEFYSSPSDRTSRDGRVSHRRRRSGAALPRHSLWLWIKFGLTLAFAVGAAVRDGPGALLLVEEGEMLR
ncbi:hypothetical protein H2203_006868 [Taxawa tesnikishii (nom. ined.)]|nr:hypothetical protein H2203_006868 [Dothideales sp. JES 119]